MMKKEFYDNLNQLLSKIHIKAKEWEKFQSIEIVLEKPLYPGYEGLIITECNDEGVLYYSTLRGEITNQGFMSYPEILVIFLDLNRVSSIMREKILPLLPSTLGTSELNTFFKLIIIKEIDYNVFKKELEKISFRSDHRWWGLTLEKSIDKYSHLVDEFIRLIKTY